ncbi:gene transfer agent family protein [Thauera sp.]|uniref:gene transfer agent family protein n=1 Tax=Thauera sp. TaxID=1905334 RepID=UPI002CD5149F|nr:gene transfer agent family protein [Thauera sp.]HRP26018.1 gene transfer agent family protein [Thauera sp.]
MTRDASIDLDFADGTYRFCLRYGELMELQEKTDAGPVWVLNRLMLPTAENRGWRVEDIVHVLRLGLIGGGMKPSDALRLVRTYVEARPPMECLLHAQAVLSAALMGAPDEAQKKSAAEPGSQPASEASGASVKPSAQVPQ